MPLNLLQHDIITMCGGWLPNYHVCKEGNVNKHNVIESYRRHENCDTRCSNITIGNNQVSCVRAASTPSSQKYNSGSLPNATYPVESVRKSFMQMTFTICVWHRLVICGFMHNPIINELAELGAWCSYTIHDESLEQWHQHELFDDWALFFSWRLIVQRLTPRLNDVNYSYHSHTHCTLCIRAPTLTQPTHTRQMCTDCLPAYCAMGAASNSSSVLVCVLEIPWFITNNGNVRWAFLQDEIVEVHVC